MSNTNNNLQTQTSNALHNAIMEAGGKDRPPMLALGNYVQWKSKIKRYINTKPNNELIHYCLQNRPYMFKWTEKTVPVAEGSSETTTEWYMENYKNVSQDIRDQLNAEAEAVQIILTGIDNNIYSTVDACPNACEMWKAIERLKQAESINVQDLETNLYWEFEKFTSRDGESLESYYSRMAKDDQDDTDELAQECDLLASLIEKLKCEINDSKNHLKKFQAELDRGILLSSGHMNDILGVYTNLDEVTNFQCDYLETLEKCEHLEKELSKSRTMSKSFEALQKHEINLEFDLQQLNSSTSLADHVKRQSNGEIVSCLTIVLHYINGVNSRTRQPIVVPISTREPKRTVNQSVATSYKKIVATDSTVKKPRNT
ncbi:hypothetical protein Tco_0779758 [Tanacetum coccineum]